MPEIYSGKQTPDECFRADCCAKNNQDEENNQYACSGNKIYPRGSKIVTDRIRMENYSKNQTMAKLALKIRNSQVEIAIFK